MGRALDSVLAGRDYSPPVVLPSHHLGFGKGTVWHTGRGTYAQPVAGIGTTLAVWTSLRVDIDYN